MPMSSRSGSQQVFPQHTNRRTFRGRGGYKDGNIPKHGKRKPLQSTRVVVEESNNCIQFTEGNNVDVLAFSGQAEDITIAEDVPNIIELNGENDMDKLKAIVKTTIATEVASSESLDRDMSPSEDKTNNEEKVMEEVSHLRSRIRNVRESIQLSSSSLSETRNWQDNCLNAVVNCAVTWISILNFHEASSLDDTVRKDVALDIFELIQMAMQCGPLSGSKPGYFKRCGSEVAMVALDFINRLPNLSSLQLTDNQVLVIQKWKSNAEKASLTNSPPSKSVLKKQNKQMKNKKSGK